MVYKYKQSYIPISWENKSLPGSHFCASAFWLVCLYLSVYLVISKVNKEVYFILQQINKTMNKTCGKLVIVNTTNFLIWRIRLHVY